MRHSENIRDIRGVHDEYEAGFWERTFGPGNEVVLRRLAEQWGQPVTKGGFFGPDSLDFNYRGFNCSINAGTEFNVATKTHESFLDFVADYAPTDNFHFRIENEGILTGLCKVLGSRDFEIGDAAYDTAFCLDSTDDKRLKQICDKLRVKGAMLRAGSCALTTDDPGWFRDVPLGMRRVRYRIAGGIRKVSDLNKQLQAFGDILDGLIETGCVRKSGPDDRRSEG